MDNTTQLLKSIEKLLEEFKPINPNASFAQQILNNLERLNKQVEFINQNLSDISQQLKETKS